MFGIGKLLESTVKTITLPIDVISDAVNVITLDDKPLGSNTLKKLDSIEETIDEIGD